MKYKTLLVILAAAAAVAPLARSQQISSQYYPLKVGSKWTYRAAEDRKVLVRVAKAEQFKIQRKDKDNKLIDDKVSGFTLESTSGDRRPKGVEPDPLREQVAVLPDGIYRFSSADKEVMPPLCILKLPPRKDQTWEVDSTIGDKKVKGTFRSGDAEITVSGKKLKCVTVFFQDEETGAKRTVLEYYFAPGVGIVKQHSRKGRIDSTIELEKYEP
jgi:hypothetical protein